MGRVQHGGRTHGSAKNQAKSIKTRRYGKDVDQVHEEVQRIAAGISRTRQTDTTMPEKDAEELPGGGEFLCVECARHFISAQTLQEHSKTKVHKRRMKQLKDDPYSQAEAERASGLGSDNRRRDANGKVIETSSNTASSLDQAMVPSVTAT